MPTMLRRLAAYRVLRIAGVALPAIVAYRWLELRGRLGRSAPPETWERVYDRVARGLHDLGIHLAGLFVKICQVVGARAGTFPEVLIRRLGRFHDAVAPRSFGEMRAQIEPELGRPLDEVFGQVEETPLAAASLAQVHRATLRDGTPVVVKVQYAEIARLARVDLACLRLLARVAGRMSRSFDLRSIIDEIAELVGLELDFAREGDATVRIRAALADDPTVRVPRRLRGARRPGDGAPRSGAGDAGRPRRAGERAPADPGHADHAGAEPLRADHARDPPAERPVTPAGPRPAPHPARPGGGASGASAGSRVGRRGARRPSPRPHL